MITQRLQAALQGMNGLIQAKSLLDFSKYIQLSVIGVAVFGEYAFKPDPLHVAPIQQQQQM